MNTQRPGVTSAPVVHVLVVSLVVALAGGAPRWANRAGLDVWNGPAAREEYRQSEHRSATLDIQAQHLHADIGLATSVVSRLIDGSVTLKLAVNELEPMLKIRPGFEDSWRGCNGCCLAPTFRKGVARYAMNKAQALLMDDPKRWGEVSARLAAEYAALE